MKNVKKIIAVGLITMVTATCFIACGDKKEEDPVAKDTAGYDEKQEATPADGTKAFLNLVLKDDKSDMEKVGLTEATYKKYRKQLEDGILKGFEATNLDSSILTKEVKNKYKDDILEGLCKIEYEVVEVSKENDTAKVEVKVRGFDFDKIATNVEEKLLAECDKNPAMTEKEIFQSTFKYMGEQMAAGTIVSEPKSVTLTVNKKDGVWLPSEGDIILLMDQLLKEDLK